MVVVDLLMNVFQQASFFDVVIAVFKNYKSSCRIVFSAKEYVKGFRVKVLAFLDSAYLGADLTTKSNAFMTTLQFEIAWFFARISITDFKASLSALVVLTFMFTWFLALETHITTILVALRVRTFELTLQLTRRTKVAALVFAYMVANELLTAIIFAFAMGGFSKAVTAVQRAVVSTFKHFSALDFTSIFFEISFRWQTTVNICFVTTR